MDLTMQMKSIELLIKFIKHDLNNISAYPYKSQKYLIPASENKCHLLPRCTPEQAGIASDAVYDMFKKLDEGTEGMHAAMVIRHGNVIAEGYWKPYIAGSTRMLYSISKSFTATAIGMAVDEGFISLDETLASIFSDLIPVTQAYLLRGMNVRHLLIMSSGSRFNEVNTVLTDDWTGMFLQSIPKFEPGSSFNYNSLNSYILAAVLKRKTGKNVCEFLKPRLFDPMKIEEYAWETCPKGIEKGGWGLSLKLEDMAKLGLLYLQKGMWEGKQLISRNWVEMATAKCIATPNGECKNGYGYHIWMGMQPDSFQFNGAFGQYVIVMPQYDAVVALFSGSGNIYSQTGFDDIVYKCFEGISETPLEPNFKGLNRLRKLLKNLTINIDFPDSQLLSETKNCERLAANLDGKEYKMANNVGGLFPMVLQSAHLNFTPGVDMISFKRIDGGIELHIYEQDECNRLPLFFDDQYHYVNVCKKDEWHKVGVRTIWNGDTIHVIAAFVETPHIRTLSIKFNANSVTVGFNEHPRVDKAIGMLISLTGYTILDFLKKIVPAFKNAQLEHSLRDIMWPKAEGILISKH